MRKLSVLNKNMDLIRRGDIIIIALFLFFGCIMFITNKFQKNDVIYAEIYLDGVKVNDINLNDVKDSSVIYLAKDHNLAVRIEKGRIRYFSSECRDQSCVKAGWLDGCGDSAACVPLRSAIYIRGGTDDQKPDIILN